ncbi:MAG: AAA family ATPase [Aureispira sp.]
MIYPQSFPKSGSSYAEEEMYTKLSSLPDRYAVFYEMAIQSKNAAIDFLLIDKERGILLIEVKSIVLDASIKRQMQDREQAFKEKIQENSKKQPLDTIFIKSAFWTTKEDSNTPIEQWIDVQFEEQGKAIAPKNFKQLWAFLKPFNKYYTPSGQLSAVHFIHFGGVENTSLERLPSTAKWLFLTGENGYGKTSILKAIALSLYGPDEYFLKYKDGNISSSTESARVPQLMVKIQSKGKEQQYNYPRLSHKKNFRNICAYGASRLSVYTERQSKKDKNPISSLFDSTTVLRNIELELYNWSLNKENAVAQKKLLHTKALLEKLLGGVKIEISNIREQVWYKEQDEEQYYEPITREHLAAGYKSLLAMIGDLILRLFDTQPDVVNPADLEGIVIIDELDLHWHPKWQKRLPGLLSKLFPRVQFIASTHSPVPLLSAPKHSVFLKVNRSYQEGITVERFTKLEKEVSRLTPNNIFTSDFFDFDFFEDMPEKQFKKLYTEDNYDDIEKNKEIDDRLNNLDADLFPDDLLSTEG